MQQVVDMLRRMKMEQGGFEPQITPQIDNLLILDRSVDPLTPLLYQLTYEGLIDEVFNIKNSKANIFFLLPTHSCPLETFNFKIKEGEYICLKSIFEKIKL